MDVFHDQEVHSPLRVEIVNRGNVEMIQFGERQGFFVEMLAGPLIGDDPGMQYFDGDFAV